MEEFFDFAYLDELKIGNFLAQKDRGTVKGRVARNAASTTLGAKGGAKLLGFGGIEGEVGKSSEREDEIEIESSAVGNFRRFRDLIADQPGFLQSARDGISFGEIPRRGFIEVDGTVRVSSIRQILSTITQITSLPPALFGNDPDFLTKKEQAQVVSQLFQADKIPITMDDDETHPVILAVLLDQALLIPNGEIEEEYSLLGKVIQVVKPQDRPYNLMKELLNPALARLPGINQQQIAQMFKDLYETLNQDEMSEDPFKLEGPMVVLSPIAMYR